MRFACRKPYFYVGGGKKNTWFKKYHKSPEANVLRGWHDCPVPCSVVLGFTCKHRKIVDLILSSYFQIISNSKRTCKNSVITFFFPWTTEKEATPCHPPPKYCSTLFLHSDILLCSHQNQDNDIATSSSRNLRTPFASGGIQNRVSHARGCHVSSVLPVGELLSPSLTFGTFTLYEIFQHRRLVECASVCIGPTFPHRGCFLNFISGRNITELIIFSLPPISGAQFQFVLWVAMFILIPWLRSSASLPSLKSRLFPFIVSIFWEIIWNDLTLSFCIKSSPISFSIHLIIFAWLNIIIMAK